LAIITVWPQPFSASLKSRVIWESRKGTFCGFWSGCCWFQRSASRQRPSVTSELLIFEASLSRAAPVSVRLVRSEPARSTTDSLLNTPSTSLSVPACVRVHTSARVCQTRARVMRTQACRALTETSLSVKTAWLRDERALTLVSATARAR
jgi:hypothetical protein